MKFKLLHHEDVWQERGCLLAFSIGITTWYYIILNNIVSITSLHRSLITERHREQNHDRAYAATQALPMPDTINSTSQISSIFQRLIHENNIHIDSSNQAYIHAYITPNTTTHTRNNNILAGGSSQSSQPSPALYSTISETSASEWYCLFNPG